MSDTTIAKRDTIIAKALRCIDEAYPDAESIGEAYFPMEDFIDEVVRWVIDSVPTHRLTLRNSGEWPEGDVTNEGGKVTMPITTDARIVYVKCDDWERPVYDIISEQNPIYRQQSNKVLRGNPSRPVVVRVGDKPQDGLYKLELYSSKNKKVTIHRVPYIEDFIPDDLVPLAAWKLAEVVLMASSDVQSASICTAKVNEHLQQLSL
jgi:hypothetical protein